MDSTGPSLSFPLGGPAGSDRAAGAPGFAGIVLGVKREEGKQTLEVQYPQGKIRFQAEGEFHVGDKVRLSFPPHGGVVVEKGFAAAEVPADGLGVGYSLPRNLEELKVLRALEEQVTSWMGGEPQFGNPSAPEKNPLARLNLPQVLMQALDRKGGKDFLAQALAGMDPRVASALLEALEEAEGEPAAKAGLADLLRPAARPGDDPTSVSSQKRPVAAAFLPAEAGAGHAPWFGRIAERRNADGIQFAAPRMGFTGGGAPNTGASMYHYTLDVGGSTLEAYSPEAREPGEFSDFVLERQGGRLQVRFLDPAQSLPPGLRASWASSPPEIRQGMLLASHYLQDFREEPYYGKLVEDFGSVLAQSGVVPPPAPGRPAGIPKQEQMDNLLKLFVSFPRDARDAAGQAAIWGDAVRDPDAFLKLLKEVQAEKDGALLRPETVLRPALGPSHLSPPSPPLDAHLAGTFPAAPKEAGDRPEWTAGWLRKLLPEAFKSADLLGLAKDAAPAGGKEHEAAKFLLQAVGSSLPQEAPVPEGKPTQFFYYQGQEWRNLQVTWRREGGGKEGRGRSGPKAPLQVNVETHSKRMGRVSVGISWEPKGARLDFRNQYQDVRDLVSRSIPELEKSLALLDFKVTAWTYEILPEDTPPSPSPGYARPLGLLDLKG